MTVRARPRSRASWTAASASTRPIPRPQRSGSTNRPSNSPPTTAAKPAICPSTSATITWPFAIWDGGRCTASGCSISWSRYSRSSNEARHCSASSTSCSSGWAYRSVTVSPGFDITPRRILDRLELTLARHARAIGLHGFAVLRLEPVEPVGPPAALMLLGALDELFERGRVLVVDPILVLLRRGRVHHARDVARPREHEPLRSSEMIHDLPHALRRRDMIFPARLNIGRRLYRIDVDTDSGDLDRPFLRQLVPLVEGLEIIAVPRGGQVRRVAVPVEQVERRGLVAHQVIVDDVTPDEIASAQQIERRRHVAAVEIALLRRQ